MFRNKINLLILTGFLILTGLFWINLTQAGTGLTIQPIKVSHTINPGETTSGIITLTNASDSGSIKVDIKVEDFVPTIGAEGVQFVGRAPGLTTARDWITLGSQDSFIFEKNEVKEIKYTIKAPADAEPGSHFAVAFFKASKYATGAEQLKVGTQVGMLIFITIPGDHLQKGQILDFSTYWFAQKSPITFKIKFENTGTVHFEPKGSIIITNIFGKEVGKVPISGQVVLPTGIKDLVFNADIKGFLIGRYNARAIIIDGDGNELTTKNIAFYAFPLWYALYFIITIIILFFLLKFLRSKISISIVKK